MSNPSNSGKIKFGTDGWRGIIADDFTFPNVRKVTRAIAGYLETAYTKDKPVLIAYDTRFLADEFAQTSAAVLADLGWNVQITDRDCPTPVIAYNARILNSAGALMFTASHNPAPYCGIKYIPDYAGPATPEITDTIVANIETASDELPGSNPSGTISTFDPKPDYLHFIYTLLDVEKIKSANLKVKYDALYSTSRGYLDEVLQHCGCQLESFHTWRDVLFGGGMPEPKGEQLVELVAAVKADHADLGLATDGDSDRFGIVDEQGNVLTPNTVLLVLARHLIKNKGKSGAIVRTVATTHLLDNFAAKYGLEIYETAVGFKYIGEKMRETAVLIGGEESGGLSIIGHIPEKDGVLADMLVAEAIAYEGKPLSQLVQEAIAEADGPLYNNRLDLHLTEAHKIAVINSYTQNPPSEVAGIKVKEVGRKDGIKLYLEEGSWVLLRPSGTEPLVRVYMETNSPEKLSQIAKFMEDEIAKLGN
ncbi:MAG: phosphoglucomutase/phosphomannomutase family protein [Dolichospermum sp.]|jgi:phosphomannomutase|uniref:phosphoglucomutase/phosphomannomutase family protein n=1 Tax=Dolichospermum circinale TaxID=109265 RepID=UPI0019B35466|nr:phosphoglucomutase/phosphomannomutase family protein [Dolichospermum circinale]MBD1211710.1 phosphoglucomutase/phosphomannomutase family protein [Dolichospermum circinale Clear-D4]MCE2719922.1 phosphoglucomutase/phosphomannomutase family protein [Anabaena sp. 49628_E55]MDB9456522.1 phosphoglucomutase/phosphomannomutase family protein [Dolichospermum circinale CS-541/06]MDB9464695.1 phosphoglucomutase/phosphomannomutase family protein [Dolichospermum circinale CS-541/04]MDB9489797.1 phosphog